MASGLTLSCLIVGAALYGFATRMGLPPIAWIALVALVHASRSMSPAAGIGGLWAALYVAFALTKRGTLPMDGAVYFIIIGAEATAVTAVFAFDRFAASSPNALVSILALPVALTAMEFLRSRYAPSASWGSIAYSQYGWLPLMQVAAVTGIWGITFLLGWFASTFELAWSHGFQWAEIKAPVLTFSAALLVILLAGQFRVLFAPSEQKTVRVATINRPVDIFQGGEMTQISGGRVAAEDRARVRTKLSRLADAFLLGSEREARAGARLIVWPEQNLLVLKEDEAAFLDRAQRLARDERTYLAMGMGTIYLGDALPFENKLVVIDPSGRIVAEHLKSRPVLGWEASVMKRGVERIPIVETEIGRVAGMICFEADFPELARQAAIGDAALLLVAANEWKAIKALHFEMQVFRTIETGLPMVRAGASGLSGAIDPWGRVLGTADFYSPGDHTMVAQLPVGKVSTLYSKVGDLFAWTCVAGLAVMLAIRAFAQLPH